MSAPSPEAQMKTPPPGKVVGGVAGVQQAFSLRVLSLEPVVDRGNIRAFADVEISGGSLWFRVCGCRLIRQPGQKAWVSLPQREYITKDGERKFAPVLKANRQVTEALLAAIEQALALNPGGVAEGGKPCI